MEQTSISKMAEAIRSKRSAIINETKSAEDLEREKLTDNLLVEFETGFAEQLPLLKESGISWSAHINSRYTQDGFYIKFKSGDIELKMDFNSAKSYRYEYTGKKGKYNYGSMCYGNWDKEDFLLFIDEHLLDKIRLKSNYGSSKA